MDGKENVAGDGCPIEMVKEFKKKRGKFAINKLMDEKINRVN